MHAYSTSKQNGTVMKSFRMFTAFFIAALMISVPTRALTAATPTAPFNVTVPMVVENHRPYVDFEITGSNGRRLKAHFYVDTGGGAILLTESLAKRLGLKTTGKPFQEGGSALTPANLPTFSLDHRVLALTGVAAFIVIKTAGGLQGTDAQGAFPARALRHYQVVFDYPARKFTVAAPHALKPEGTPVKTYIGDAGMPVVTLAVDGAPHDFLMDTGGTYCMISAAQLGIWAKQHPQWPHASGAYGPANMLVGPGEVHYEMLRIAAMQWGPFALKHIGAVSRPVNAYEKFMSQIAGKPVIGSIAGNVLQAFRVDIDYPGDQIYLEHTAGIRDKPLSMVPVTLELKDRSYVVAGTAPGMTAIHKGDRLLHVGTLDAQTATLAEIVRALQGKVGIRKNLLIERGGRRLEIQSRVRLIL